MAREILLRVSVCVAWTAILTLAYEFGGDTLRGFRVPATTHVFLGSALALLLVFRTNSSYERFWEGRKLWGGIVNESRNLVRTTAAFLAADPDAVREITLWAMAFPWGVMAALRGSKNLGPAAADLPTAASEEVIAAEHVPLAIACRITAILERARSRGLIDSVQLAIIDRNTQQLIDYAGGCERIRATLLPYAYTVHLRRVLLLFFLTLPVVLIPEFGWSTIIAVLVSSYVFFGIEEIGVEVEAPFGDNAHDLPLERICQTIAGNLRATLPGEAPPA
jgi:putative membrane protein